MANWREFKVEPVEGVLEWRDGNMVFLIFF